MKRALLVAIATWPLGAPPAFADIAPPTPEDMSCPRGAAGRVITGEGRGFNAFCEPTTCESDDDCDGDRTCSSEEIGLCVEDRDGQRSARARGCEPDGTCLNMQSTCETARRCVSADDGEREDVLASAPDVELVPEAAPAPDPAPAPTSEPDPVDGPLAPPAGSGCACRATPRASGPLGLLLILGLCALRRR